MKTNKTSLIERAELAGYNDASLLSFREPGREVMRIVPTEDGFDIEIAEGITITEAAQKFICIVKELLANQ
ncbi:hypothetical protein EBT16_02850 [bacterium]|nr:hypothetical protein [bacterium]